MFVSGGENIFPQPIEEVLERYPKVRESLVIGLSDEKWGRVTAAYIVPNHNLPAIEELDLHCLEASDLANYKRPRYYQFVDELPYTSTGKKLRYKMREQADRERERFIPISSERR
jgi:acyl-CoA synthetase (AMP-forming)/AMP-acid ligase II